MERGFVHFFRVSRGCVWHGRARAGWSGCVEVCEALDAPGTELFHDSAKIRAGQAGGFFVKRYNLPGWITQLRRLFKPSRPEVVRHGAELLTALHIPTPQVMATAARWHFLWRREYLVTAMLAPGDRLLNEPLSGSAAAALWTMLLEKFLPMLVKLHDAGGIHGDLNLRNCYVSAAGEAGLIDLDGMVTRRRPLRAAVREAELARLVSSYLKLCGIAEDWMEHAVRAADRYRELSGMKLSAAAVFRRMERIARHRKRR